MKESYVEPALGEPQRPNTDSDAEKCSEVITDMKQETKSTVEETIPGEWRENPLPRSAVSPKRPRGRPKKRPNDQAREELKMVGENEAIMDKPALGELQRPNTDSDAEKCSEVVTSDMKQETKSTVEETIPGEWRENPLPRSAVTPKRPRGRPKKRPNDQAREKLKMVREDEAIVDKPSPKRGKYSYYSLKQKQEILEEVELCGLRPTARKWAVAPATLAQWKKDLAEDVQRHKSGRKIGGGRHLSYDKEIEEQVVVWVLERREHQLPISYDSIRQYILTLTKEKFPEFKASSGWMTRFMARHNLNVRQHTSLSLKLPCDLEVRLAAFYKHLKELRVSKELDEDVLILNMDEVPMVFDTVPSTTLHKRGEKGVQVKNTGWEKKYFTAVLAINAAGMFLPTMTIFKGRQEPEDLQVKSGWIVCCNENAWMREELMIRWVKEILRPYTQSRPALLVMDSLAAHITSNVRAELEKINTYPAIIPGGCTRKAQPLEVVINKPFKDRIRKFWTLFMQDRQAQAKDSIALQVPSRQDLISWMEAAQNELQQAAYISKAFKVTGISTSLGGTEDHMVHDPDLIPENIALESDEEADEFSGFEESDVDDPFIDPC